MTPGTDKIRSFTGRADRKAMCDNLREELDESIYGTGYGDRPIKGDLKVLTVSFLEN